MLDALSPIDVMTMTMNGYVAAAQILGEKIVRVDEKIVRQMDLLTKASLIAKDLAPYKHPRLANVEVTGKDGKPMEVKHTFTVEVVKTA